MGTKAPEIQITIGEQDLEVALGCSFGRVLVELDMDRESGASIEIINGYKVENSSLVDPMKRAFLLGSKVEIQMGYAGVKGKVFAGYLESITLSVDQKQSYLLQLQTYDAIKLMKENSYCRILTEQKHTDVCTSILAAYQWVGLNTSCDDTVTYEAAKCWYQNESDYEFIMRELVERCSGDWEFYISAGTAYYKQPNNKTVVAEISISSGIQGFWATEHFLNRTVEVYGSSQMSAAYTGSTDAASTRLWSSAGKGKEMLINPDADSQDMADGMATARANRLTRQSKQIKIILEGNQVLLTGSYVTIAGIDSIWNGTYRIRRATHSYDENGYQTEVTLEGS